MHAAHQVTREALHGLVQSQAASDITRNNRGVEGGGGAARAGNMLRHAVRITPFHRG